MSKNNILTIITGSVVAVVIIATVAIIIKDSHDKKADTFTPVEIEQEAVTTDADLSASAVSIEEGENAGSIAADGNSTGDVDDSKASDAGKASSSKKDSSFAGETAIIGDDGKPVVLPASKQAATEGQTEANDDHTGNSSVDEPADYFDASDGQVIQTPKIRIK